MLLIFLNNNVCYLRNWKKLSKGEKDRSVLSMENGCEERKAGGGGWVGDFSFGNLDRR